MDRRLVAAVGGLMVLTACSGSVTAEDLVSEEETAYNLLAELEVNMSADELACVVREINDAEVALPRQSAAELDVDDLSGTEVAGCSDDAAPIESLVNAVTEARDEHIAALADQIEPVMRVASDDPATIDALSSPLEAAVAGRKLDGYLNALQIPSAIQPDDTMLVNEATATVNLQGDHVVAQQVQLAWLMEDSFDGLDPYVERLEDDDFVEDEDAQVRPPSLDQEDISFVSDVYVRGEEQVIVETARGEALNDVLYVQVLYESGPIEVPEEDDGGQGDDSSASDEVVLEQAGLEPAGGAHTPVDAQREAPLLPTDGIDIGDEHAWVNDLQLPENAQIRAISSGIAPSQGDSDLALVRAVALRLPIPDAEPFGAIVERGDLIDGADLSVVEQSGDFSSTKVYQLADDAGMTGSIDARHEGAEILVNFDAAAPTDVETGEALDLQPEVDDGFMP